MKKLEAATPGGGLPVWADLQGKLLVVEPLEFEQGVKTQNGVTDAVRGNIFAINAKGEVLESFEDTLIFPKALVSATRRKIDSLVVGVLTQGEKSPGKNAPWLLSPPNDKHMAAAARWLASESAVDDTEDGEVSDAPDGLRREQFAQDDDEDEF